MSIESSTEIPDGSTTLEAPQRERRQAIWALAGGKGGAGRSLLAANLGVQLARSGRRVVLVDLDLQGSNLHSYLGYQRLPRSLGDLAGGKSLALSELACETTTGQLRLVGGMQRAELRDDPVAFVRQVVEQFPSLSADFIIVDCGSGRSRASIAAFAEATLGILVVTPEPTALESVYMFAQSYLQWCLTRALTGEALANLEARIREEGHDPRHLPFRAFMKRLGAIDAEARERVAEVVRATRLELILNQVRSPADEEAAGSLASGFRKCFGLPVHIAGIIEHDLSVLKSAQKRRSLSQQYPNAAATRAISGTVNRLFSISEAPRGEPDEEWEDLEAIDHYRVLEVAPKATPKEVQSAYQLLKKTFDPETTHLSPVLEAQGLREMLARIEAAYRTLIFLESRATYDQQMRISGLVQQADMPEPDGREATPSPAPPAVPEENVTASATEEAASDSADSVPGGDAAAAPANPSPRDATEPIEPAPARPVPSTGAQLRDVRKGLGLTLDAIAEETKVRPAHLDSIEREQFGDLPAPVFVRGFLREYSRCMGLPADEVIRRYMLRYEDWRASGRLPGDPI
ncbi:MAG: helix-turn-helix domain-containing protein [Acidobacteriota bacterium]